MSIRRTLLVAFVSIGLVCALLASVLAFFLARDVLQAEIERSLVVQAAGVSGQIDKMMFERLQNATTWSSLDIMQDIQVQDVDKRLSRFLAGLHDGYRDVYSSLEAIDLEGRIVSSSDAGRIGSKLLPVAETVATYSSDGIALAFAPAGESTRVEMSVPVQAGFRTGLLGALRLRLDWARIEDVLDQGAGKEGRELAVLDREGRLLAASAGLRRRGWLLTQVLSDWRLAGHSERPGRPLTASRVIVREASSTGYAGFAGFHWTTLVIQPVDIAFAPIHRLGLVFIGLFGAILLLTVVTALWISRHIARPIGILTHFARGYMSGRPMVEPPSAGAGEVGELTKAYVSMLREITLSHQNLVRASKLAVVGEMSAVIAHEVRTPLGILKSSAQMLRREVNISSEGRELLGFIESETDRLNGLVSAMLDTARPRPAAYRPTDINALVADCSAMLAGQAATRQVRMWISAVADDAIIGCDPDQMTQVVLNILMNGLQILEHGGQIDISIGGSVDTLQIEIADDGPGIDPSQRSRVFEAFFFQRAGGIGLGLAIVQQIVTAHGGEIMAGESPSGGALFRITLPRSQPGIP